MSSCAACGFANREGAKFCSECGLALEAPAAPREERKVVSVLFADLVGFTSKAERLDPEEVRAVLAPYHALLREELERFGGTVEKFIGDAVMALFGAPVSHEDDPERAVRAALRIRDSLVEEGRLDVRIGITTGEVLVALGARPSEGEGMASGDVVNTAARLQSAAPTNGIIVDEATYRFTRGVIDYREEAHVDAKGKSQPVRVWEVVAARARLGVEPAARESVDLVGRREELRLLVDTLARVRRAREPQVVTVTGVPGIGKSRLVYELFKTVESGSVLTYWRQGRCPSYGDGVTFWALAEIIKSHAGIFETDGARNAEEKLERVTRLALADPTEAEWALRHLRPLVGLDSGSALAGDRRSEAFAAWRRLFEALAEQHPFVLVVEDIQWADDGLLDFLEELVRRASGVPLIVLCTGRPELFDRRPTWGGGQLNAITVSLAPLDDDETSSLLAAHVERAAIDDDTRARLLARAGGNPLYAEEFARMVAELGVESELDVPDSVQGIIAARLDLLPPEEKELLQNAAVVGKQFWTGAVSALGSVEVEERLRLLEERDFVRRARRSSVDGEDEFAFRHILTRDVAYAQIPRARRAVKHALAAEWIDSLSKDRADDKAEMLAFHYESALELAPAGGEPTPDLERRARAAFRDAGEHALSLNAFKPATRFFADALELWPDDDARPWVLYRYGLARFHAEGLGREELEAARDELLALGEVEPAVEATLTIATLTWLGGGRDATLACVEHALELSRHGPPRARARALTTLARYQSIAGLRGWELLAQEALALAEELDDDELRMGALISLGTAESLAHPSLAGPSLERAIEIARARNSSEIVRACNNLAYVLWRAGQVDRARALAEESIEYAEKFGDHSLGAFVRAGLRLTMAVKRGEWESALRTIDEFLDRAHSADYQKGNVLKNRGRIRLMRDDLEGGLEDVEVATEDARRIGDPQRVVPDLSSAVGLFAQAGAFDRADVHADELVPAIDQIGYELTFELADLGPALHLLGRDQELARLLAQRSPDTPWKVAAERFLERDYVSAAEVYAELGLALDEAECRTFAAERLAADGRHGEAAEQAALALAFHERVGASRAIRRLRDVTDALKQSG